MLEQEVLPVSYVAAKKMKTKAIRLRPIKNY